ncbi:hypothetical protein CDL15_Pgr027345 [Punica granatum]|uniref:Uncharacterized protein n=1 Tax=Punica granatum TaxID=22663 RepID=A0A218WD18_PUNGR|nr:hypothetical protein CDL15_Pgr027345 [Punica granatum]PKI40498.1 hypothetical protein CRG98_039134 [Punica granatum]
MHGGRVADEADMDARHVEVNGGGVIVGNDSGDGIDPVVLSGEGGQRVTCCVGGLGSEAATGVDGVLGDIAEAEKGGEEPRRWGESGSNRGGSGSPTS